METSALGSTNVEAAFSEVLTGKGAQKEHSHPHFDLCACWLPIFFVSVFSSDPYEGGQQRGDPWLHQCCDPLQPHWAKQRGTGGAQRLLQELITDCDTPPERSAVYILKHHHAWLSFKLKHELIHYCRSEASAWHWALSVQASFSIPSVQYIIYWISVANGNSLSHFIHISFDGWWAISALDDIFFFMFLEILCNVLLLL